MATHLKTISVDYTEAELATMGKQLAESLANISALEAEMKKDAQAYKDRIADERDAVKDLAGNIRRGFRLTDVVCDVRLNTPRNGQKTYLDVSTGDWVATEDMTEDEKQDQLFPEPEMVQ